MIDSIGDVIVGLSASIAAGSGISAFRLLRRVQNLESHYSHLPVLSNRLVREKAEIEQRLQDQSIFNSVIEERLEALENKPAPKQDKKMGTPKPTTARGLLYGRTRQGP